MIDILSIGEVLIDLIKTPATQPQKNVDLISPLPSYTAFPGGAPANLAVAASRLGSKTAFIGKVGNDYFGRFLCDTLKADSVDTDSLFFSETSPTTLAVVSVDDKGERSFSFYRNGSADTLLTAEEVSKCRLFSETKVLHFGSVSLTHPSSSAAVFKALELAKEKGVTISYDPNYRPALWSDKSKAVNAMLSPLSYVDLLKVSDEELPILTGTHDVFKGAKLLSEQGPALVLVTLGPKGAFIYKKNASEFTATIPGYVCKVADTNGAGDTFFGAFLSRFTAVEKNEALSEDYLKKAVAFANKAASITTSRHGAIPAMPYLSEFQGIDEDFGFRIDKF